MRHTFTRWLFGLLGFVALFAQTTHAQTTTTQIYTASGYESITVSTVSIGFTTAAIAATGQNPAVTAFCTLATAAVRFRYDGTAPTSSEGHPLAADQSFTLYGTANVAAFRAIRSGGSDGILKCTYSNTGRVVK